MKPARYREMDWPHGLRCAECDVLFVEGMPICESPESMFEDGTIVVVVVCASCDLGGE